MREPDRTLDTSILHPGQWVLVSGPLTLSKPGREVRVKAQQGVGA